MMQLKHIQYKYSFIYRPWAPSRREDLVTLEAEARVKVNSALFVPIHFTLCWIP